MTTSLVSPELVGRGPQVARLDDALGRARGGFPSIVLVRGEAGVGKSRLLQEFLSTARDTSLTTLSGSCVDVSAGDLPFVPFRTAFRHLVRTRPPEDLAELFDTSWRDMHVLLPELAAGSRPVETGPGSPHVFEVVASVVAQMAREHCVVFAVDDAQWADQSTLQLLRYLTLGGPPLPLLVVVAYRGEELPPDPQRQQAFEELSRCAADVVTVSPLRGEQVEHLVRCLGVELSDQAMRRLQTRCSGLPFLVEELAAAENEGLTRGIPGRLRDVVRLRLGRLSAPARLVVTLVAVAGRPMTHGVLSGAADLRSGDLAEALDEALTSHLLVEDRDDGTYGFRHAVAREIVHDELRTAVRLDLHARLAAALQADLHPDAYATRLCEVAFHWSRTAGREPDAIRAALLAARASTRANAHPEAARQYDHVISLWSQVTDPESVCGTDLVTLSSEAADAARWAGSTDAALRHIDLALGATPGDQTATVVGLQERRSLYSWLDSGTLARGPDLLAQVSGTVTGERMRASDLMQSGRYAESLGAARAAIHLAQRSGNAYEEIRGSVIEGVGLAMTGAVAEGVSILGQALQDALRREDDETTITTQINLSFVLLVDGQWQEAARVALQGLEHAEKRGTSGADGALLAPNAAEALIRLGRLTQATQILERALDADPPPAVTRVLLLSLAEADVLSGKFGDADAALRSIVAGGGLEDFQFQQQMRSVEAELQLWHPSAAHAVALEDLRRSLGSSLSEVAGEDVPLAARSSWLGVRADADAASSAAMARDERRVDELADDALRLQQATRALEGRALSAGVRVQLDRFLALVAAELSRLRGAREPELWRTAASLATNDPYLRAYSLWRLGASLHALRRRRDATAVLREAYAVSREAEVRVVADMVRATARSLGVEVENETDATPRRSSPFHLTPRELEVLELLVQGLSNRRIARALFMSEKTASVHVSHILAKLSVSGRGEAVARAYEVGLASVTDE
jgi:DNA-binding NarL/FixJ family response regulator